LGREQGIADGVTSVRKFLPLFVILLVLFPSCAATLSLPELEHESDLFAWWLHNLKSPEQLQMFLQNCVYASDFEQFGKIEYYQTPNEFFYNRKGDCEDFAYFSAYVFLRKHWAFRSWVVFVTLRNGGGVHAVAVVRNETGYVAIDYSYISESFPTLEEAIETVTAPYGYSFILKVYEVKLPETKSDAKEDKGFCPIWGCE